MIANATDDAIPLHRWLGFLDSEYLTTFIRDGGASIKFAVTSDRLRSDLRDAVKARCSELDYLCVDVDAVTSRVYMPQDIFFAMARQIDWRLLANRMVLRLASERGFAVDGIDPAASGSVLDAIAAANGLDSSYLSMRMARPIQDSVFKNLQMSKDFRVAMTHLCIMSQERMTQGLGAVRPIINWLTGVSARMGNVRPFAIHTPINRTTARYFIESALHWVEFVGYSGTVILLDNTRVTLARNPRDGKRYYTRPMTMDHYELLREFVDSVDRLNGMLMVVTTNPDFVDEDHPRSYAIYQALQTRIMNDVRDKNLANPIASLVRLS